MLNRTGQVWIKYELLERIGKGDGTVYKAIDIDDRVVAVKVLNRAVITDISVSRFRAEARTAITLKHPNVVEVYEFAEANLASSTS